MPYRHIGCGGKIGLLNRKCKKCGKQWPITALLAYRIPEGMEYIVNEPPRWLRMIVRLSIVVIAIACMAGIFSIVGLNWSILGVLFTPIIVVAIIAFRKSRG